MKSLRLLVAGALAVGGAVVAGAVAAQPALAQVSPHCQDSGFCLFPEAGFAGTRVVVPAGSGCRPVGGLGITTARSAARGYGDGYALQLYADAGCTASVGTVTGEVPSTSATAYRLIAIPR